MSDNKLINKESLELVDLDVVDITPSGQNFFTARRYGRLVEVSVLDKLEYSSKTHDGLPKPYNTIYKPMINMSSLSSDGYLSINTNGRLTVVGSVDVEYNGHIVYMTIDE